MDIPTTRKAEYRQWQEEAARQLACTQRRITQVSLLRLLIFVAGAAGAVYALPYGSGAVCVILLVALLPFLLLVKHHNTLFHRKAYEETALRVSKEELDALDYHYEAFDDGAEFVSPTHAYSFDLDLFGPSSLFQYLNRTCTAPGRRRLAQWMEAPLLQAGEIKARQEAVEELARATEFRKAFRITGLLYRGQAADEQEVKAWAEGEWLFAGKKLPEAVPFVVGGINLLCLLGVAGGLLPGAVWGTVWMAFVLLSFTLTNRITRLQAAYGRRLHILGTYARLMQLTDAQTVKAPLLQRLKEQTGGTQREATQAIGTLARRMEQLDWRNNYLIYCLLNGLFFWELWQTLRIERWRRRYAARLPQWLDAIGHMDGLCTLAHFAYNHPDYCFPQPEDTTQGFCLDAEDMGHPLIPHAQCVRNPIRMEQRPAFFIITGANMAGKSTYLRTIGVNLVLAGMGAPVCATRMRFTPIQLMTSLRTTDSLNEHESYFFAELKRLKQLIERLQAGERLFVILDEILKGTNSVDKQKGSLALVEQLLQYGANGLIATHDLQLGTLAERFPHQVSNFCFDADIVEDELHFTYRMRPGVAQHMNACFLMRKMGISRV